MRRFNRAVTWGDKIRDSQLKPEYLQKRGKQKPCEICGRDFVPYTKNATVCSRECAYQRNYVNVDGVEKKAIIFGANLLIGGRGSKEKRPLLMKMIQGAIGAPCPYCGVVVTLDNISLDHKTPYGDTDARRSKKGNEEIRRKMDDPSNLQMTCLRCNSMKADMTDQQFRDLLEFLSEYPDASLKKHIETRLMRSLGFGRRFR